MVYVNVIWDFENGLGFPYREVTQIFSLSLSNDGGILHHFVITLVM